MSLSVHQIAAQLERVLASDPATIALAIRAQSRQSLPDSLRQRGRQFALRWCESSLAIREALCEAEDQDPGTSGLVIVTPLATHELAEDIVARIARGRVFQPEGWEIVRQLFEARETDARLGRFPWMPQCLVDCLAQGEYPPVVNGFLGLDTVWQELLQRTLGLSSARPDAVALLTWSTTVGAEASLEQFPAAARDDLLNWLSAAAGPAGELVLGCIEAGRTADALPLGLVCGVVFALEGEGQAELGQASIRLERFVNDRRVGVVEGRGWAQAAEQVVRAQGFEATRGALDRADAVLRELDIAEFATLSDLLPAALDQRLRDFAQVLAAHVAEAGEETLMQVEGRVERVLRHALMVPQSPRAERLEMARRLARWLLTPSRGAPTLSAAAAWQADEGAFVDWARFRLLGGDEIREVSEAFAALRQAVTARRNGFAELFARALVNWNANKPAVEGRVVPLESVLERVVASIAGNKPMLLLVMDGLSISIFRELFARISAHGWAEMVPDELGHALVGLAVVPTVTEVSRASLLCGRLTLGVSGHEKSGFAANPALLARSKAGAPPRLFHKGDLADASNLAAEVRSVVADPHQRIVGVVYNAVDDHLSGPDQLNQRWSLEDLRLLLPLLREAREARRAIVVTADHGHLLEDLTSQVADGGESDRWRPGKEARAPHEIAVAGGRVVTSDGSNGVVCLWGEGTRYGGRKNGYHGGLSPQEVTVPLAVLVPRGDTLPGWKPAPPAQPDWWELPPLAVTMEQTKAPAPPVKPPARKTPSAVGQSQLFDEKDLPPTCAPEVSDWVGALLVGAVYVSQRQLAARVALPDDQMRILLTALAERGGKLSRVALAQRLSLPELRLGGVLSAARRVLNVDQAPVLVVDEATGAVELNLPLLRQQFSLSVAGAQR